MANQQNSLYNTHYIIQNFIGKDIFQHIYFNYFYNMLEFDTRYDIAVFLFKHKKFVLLNNLLKNDHPFLSVEPIFKQACKKGYYNFIKYLIIRSYDINNFKSYNINYFKYISENISSKKTIIKIIKFIIYANLFINESNTLHSDIKEINIYCYICETGILKLFNLIKSKLTNTHHAVLYSACKSDNVIILNELLNIYKNILNLNTLYNLIEVASKNGKLEILKQLINFFTNTNSINDIDFSSAVNEAIVENRLDIIKCIINQPNIYFPPINRYRSNWLYNACKYQCTDIIILLVNKNLINDNDLKHCDNCWGKYHEKV
jgi:hypothetical protein